MAQKGKIRELQEGLKIQRQAAKALGEYCTKYKQDIKDLEGKVKILTIQNVSCFSADKVEEAYRDGQYDSEEGKGNKFNINNYS